MPRKKQKYQRWGNLKKVAAAAGVSYGHARLVLAGKRQSQKLLAQLRALNFEPRTKTQKTP